MSDPYFPLGYPPQDDVEEAAKLLVRYQRKKSTPPETFSSFVMLVKDWPAVRKRAEELLGADAA